MSLFAELKRRNVFRVGFAYAVVGWLVAQVADLALEIFGTPDWVMKTLLFLILIRKPGQPHLIPALQHSSAFAIVVDWSLV